MIVYSGLGGSALVFGVLGAALFPSLLPEHLPELSGFLSHHGISDFAASMAFVGIITFFLGFLANSSVWHRKEVDEDTGEIIMVGTVSSLFWLPLQYWGVVFAGIGILNYFGVTEIAGVGLR